MKRLFQIVARLRDRLRSLRQESLPAEARAVLLRRRALTLLPGMVLLLFAAVCVRDAWVADDAFIAFRAVFNLDHGHGLVSNPGERVQAFTSPLWVLLMSLAYQVMHESFFTSIDLSIVLSVVAAGLVLFKVAKRPIDALCLGMVLPFSRAYTDFSTSGLENPLSHLLLVSLLLVYFKSRWSWRSVFALTMLGALLLVTRLDHLFLVAPLLLHAWLAPRSWRVLPAVLLGLAPLLLWESFALVYYGFPYPNTAYAKLTTDLPASTMMMQGFGYLVDSLSRDPITLVVIFGGFGGAFVVRHARAWVPMLGVLLHLGYVVKVGGDFMSGRFLTASFIVAVVVLLAWVMPLLATRWAGGVGVVVAMIVLCAPFNPLKPVQEPCVVPDNGITDERDCYFDTNGLLRNVHRIDDAWGYQRHKYWKEGLKKRDTGVEVAVDNLVGMGGYAAGPGVHIIDHYALTDPLLARIPFHPTGAWRIGHFFRPIPEGYLETLRSGRNDIKNHCVSRYYDKLELVVRGPLWSRARLRAVVDLNLGRLDHLLDPACQEPGGEGPDRGGFVANVPTTKVPTIKARAARAGLPLRQVRMPAPAVSPRGEVDAAISRDRVRLHPKLHRGRRLARDTAEVVPALVR